MKKAIWLCSFFLLTAGLFAQTFAFKFTKGEKYRIVATVEEKVLQNDELIGQASFLDKIAVTVTDVKNGSGNISALYEIAERRQAEEGIFQLSSEDKSDFTLDANGRYTVAASSFLPPVRNIPLFPQGNITPGFVWSAQGIEIFDLRDPFGIQSPIRIPVDVQYKYLGVKEKNGKKIAQFGIEYEYRYDLKGMAVPAEKVYPLKISGAHSMTLNWDCDAGKQESYEEEFYRLYNLSDGQWIEYMGKARGDVVLSPPLDKEKAVEDINREIEKKKVEGVHAAPADQGVKITLENIQFQPDSDVITPGEARKIEIIADILKKYPDRDIKVVGHTAAVGTPESCLELSVRRARGVGDALLKLGARRADQLTIQGKGLTEPIAPNSTEAGRIKNRRVEVILLEN